MPRVTERGSLPFEVVLVALLVALAGCVIYQNGKARQALLIAGIDQAGQIRDGKPANTTVPQSLSVSDVSDAKAQTQALYYSWLEDSRGTNYDTDIAVWQQQGLVTGREAASLRVPAEFDKLTCSQNPLKYNEYLFSDPTASQDSATMTVSGTYVNSTTTITVTLVRADGKWAVDSIACPSP
jgi:hypothetical protein